MATYKFLSREHNSMVIDINYQSLSNWCPIHYAARINDISILSLLLNKPELDINSLTDFKQTALHIAAEVGNAENCELLISAGICVDFQNL